MMAAQQERAESGGESSRKKPARQRYRMERLLEEKSARKAMGGETETEEEEEEEDSEDLLGSEPGEKKFGRIGGPMLTPQSVKPADHITYRSYRGNAGISNIVTPRQEIDFDIKQESFKQDIRRPLLTAAAVGLQMSREEESGGSAKYGSESFTSKNLKKEVLVINSNITDKAGNELIGLCKSSSAASNQQAAGATAGGQQELHTSK
jgi:hypothetical protein